MGTPQYTHSESRFTFAGLNGFVISSLTISRYPSAQACINIWGILFGSALPSWKSQIQGCKSTFPVCFSSRSLRFLLLTATHIGRVIHGTPQYTHILGILFGSALPSWRSQIQGCKSTFMVCFFYHLGYNCARQGGGISQYLLDSQPMWWESQLLCAPATGPLQHMIIHVALTFAPAFMSSFTIDSCSLITAHHNGVHSNVYCLRPCLPLPFTGNVFVRSRSTFTDAFHNCNCRSLRFLLLTATHIGFNFCSTTALSALSQWKNCSRSTFLTLHSKLLTYTVSLKYSLTSCEYFWHPPAFSALPDAVSCF